MCTNTGNSNHSSEREGQEAYTSYQFRLPEVFIPQMCTTFLTVLNVRSGKQEQENTKTLASLHLRIQASLFARELQWWTLGSITRAYETENINSYSVCVLIKFHSN